MGTLFLPGITERAAKGHFKSIFFYFKPSRLFFYLLMFICPSDTKHCSQLGFSGTDGGLVL
jgi:hypothetical protein